MAKNDNLTDFLTDVADAIRAKKGTTEAINPQNFADEIASIQGGGGGSMWTGHADAEGLRAIGWTEEDIAYYQQYGVDWNEEDDQYHLVSDDNKALYGVLNANNISSYTERIVYLPKIDISSKTSMQYMFDNCKAMLAIPMLDTSNVTNMYGVFSGCDCLVCVPLLDTSKVTTMYKLFYNCTCLRRVPSFNTSNVTTMYMMCYNANSIMYCHTLDTKNVTNMGSMFYGCKNLTGMPQLNTSLVTQMNNMFYNCYSLRNVVGLDVSNATSIDNIVTGCKSLHHLHINGISKSVTLNNVPLLSKESLLYIIEHEATSGAITIQLASYAYTRLSTDADILAALTEHPNITLAK